MAESRSGGRSRSARTRIGGTAQLLSNLNRWGNTTKRVVRDRGLVKCGIYLYTESQKQVPIVSGNLRASGFIVTSTSVVRKGRKFKGKMAERMTSDHSAIMDMAKSAAGGGVAVGYSAVYALRTHENPYAGRTHGFGPQGQAYTAGTLPSGRKSTRKVYSTVGKWKFLEDPMKSNQVAFLYILAKEAMGQSQSRF